MALFEVQLLTADSQVPSRGSEESAGYDIRSVVECTIPPWSRAIIPTGISCRPPVGTYIRIAPRSGLAAKESVDVAAGVVDRDYRGEIKAVLVNNSSQPFCVEKGSRIAQLILEKICHDVTLNVVETLSETERGAGGFGSTGK